MLSEKERTILRTSSYANASLFCTAQVANHSRELTNRCNTVRSGDLHRRLWHSVNDRAVAILKHSQSTRRAHPTQALRAVATHSGENYADTIASKYFRNGCEQRVSRWPHAPHSWRCVETDRRTSRKTAHSHVKSARSEI